MGDGADSPLTKSAYDGMCYEDIACSACLGKIDDVGILDPATKHIMSYDGQLYRLNKVNVKNDSYEEGRGHHM